MPKEHLKKLLELQHEQLVLEESEIVHNTSEDEKTSQTKEKVAKLREEIPIKLLRKFDQFFKKSKVGIALEINGSCKNCNMIIPKGDLSRMQTNAVEPICPDCRILLYLETYNID